MSSTFEKRERAEEAKYARDAEVDFKVNAKRNKLLGLWAAGLIGLSGEEAELFARQTVLADFEEPGPEDVLRQVMKGLEDANVRITEVEVRDKMEGLMKVAREQVES